jgi:hypothetical protein
MKAIHGGKVKNDKVDAFKIAHLLRGGNLPHAYVYPPETRATRDLLRRRLHFVRRRGNLLAHIQNTHHQYNLDVPAKKVAYGSNREGVAERFVDSDVRKSLETDLATDDDYTLGLGDVEDAVRKAAKKRAADRAMHDRVALGMARDSAEPIIEAAAEVFGEAHATLGIPQVRSWTSASASGVRLTWSVTSLAGAWREPLPKEWFEPARARGVQACGRARPAAPR